MGMIDSTHQDWDAQVQRLGGGILQGEAWAGFQESLGRDVLRENGNDWIWQAFIRSSRGLKYLIVPYGPVVQSGLKEAIDIMVFAADEQDCDFVRIEPVGTVSPEALGKLGARQIKELQPQHTFVLDLRPSEVDLRTGLESGHRNRINTTEKRGIKIRQVRDMTPFNDFIRLMDDTARHAKIVNYSDNYFYRLSEELIEKGIASFYVSTVEDGKPASISLVYDWGQRRYYAHTGNDQVLNRQYNVAVSAVWQMILDAKQQGLDEFDFWGAAPDDSADHKWAGITSFKKGFGGNRVSTIGTWDIPLKRSKYMAYQVYRRLRGFE
ncbi:MAG: peptidoglycan bridge formation glycyltransferase FemA/FemB family protein [Candidatus Saccharibacteria bacterium]